MPLPTNYSRPTLPYVPLQSLPNNQRFTLLGQRPPTAQMFDAELNALTDDINILADAINKVQAGIIIGSDDPANADKLLKTNGLGVISWIKISDVNIADQAITTRTLQDGAVTTRTLQDGAVTNKKIGYASVTKSKISSQAITTSEVQKYGLNIDRLSPITSGQLLVGDNGTGNIVGLGANAANLVLMSTGNNTKPQFSKITDANVQAASIGNASLAAYAIATANIQNNAVTAAKISSSGGVAGTVLTAGAGALTSWAAIPTTGQILQVVQYQYNDNAYTIASKTFVSFSTPFQVTITPQKANSTILVYLSVNLAGGSTQDDCVYGLLCKNNSPWQESVQTSRANLKATFSFMQEGTDALYTQRHYSGMFVDNNHNTNAITYELKACNTYDGSIKSAVMNATSNKNNVGVSTIYAIEIDL